MNRPLGQALQIVALGLLIIAVSAAIFWSWTRDPEAAVQGATAVSGAESGATPSTDPSLIVLICLAGAVGGVVNNFRRLQQLQLHDWDKLDDTSRWLMTLQIYVSPLVGALFAFVLYGMFASNLLQGALFPAFDLSAPFTSLSAFSETTIPATNADVGKALFWAFVAGFAEGFVPNFIDKLARSVEAAADKA